MLVSFCLYTVQMLYLIIFSFKKLNFNFCHFQHYQHFTMQYKNYEDINKWMNEKSFFMSPSNWSYYYLWSKWITVPCGKDPLFCPLKTSQGTVCYRLQTEPFYWEQAVEECDTKHQSDLTSIHSKEEANFIFEMVIFFSNFNS